MLASASPVLASALLVLASALLMLAEALLVLAMVKNKTTTLTGNVQSDDIHVTNLQGCHFGKENEAPSGHSHVP